MLAPRLRLLVPPALVQVRDRDGVLRRALLVARREDRCFLQVGRGPGDNVLRWLPAADVRTLAAPRRPVRAPDGPGGNPGDAPHPET